MCMYALNDVAPASAQKFTMRPGRYGDGGCVAERGDDAVADDERLIIACRCTRPVDHAGVGQRDDRSIDGDECPDADREWRSLGPRRCGEQREQSERCCERA